MKLGRFYVTADWAEINTAHKNYVYSNLVKPIDLIGSMEAVIFWHSLLNANNDSHELPQFHFRFRPSQQKWLPNFCKLYRKIFVRHCKNLRIGKHYACYTNRCQYIQGIHLISKHINIEFEGCSVEELNCLFKNLNVELLNSNGELL